MDFIFEYNRLNRVLLIPTWISIPRNILKPSVVRFRPADLTVRVLSRSVPEECEASVRGIKYRIGFRRHISGNYCIVSVPISNDAAV